MLASACFARILVLAVACAAPFPLDPLDPPVSLDPLAPPARTAEPVLRRELSLDGAWLIAAGSSPELAIRVPDAFESALGADFDGIATYRRDFVLPADFDGERLVLEFDAVATHASVRLNGTAVGEHLGGWTPFRCDITAAARRGGPNRLEVVVDERVGHDTQGFLPIVAPHFGGIWQPVRLLGLPARSLDDLSLLAFGDAERSRLVVEAPAVDLAEGDTVEVEIAIGERRFRRAVDAPRVELEVSGFEPWSPGSAQLYPVAFELKDATGRVVDRVLRRAGFRTLRADGRRILFNGSPLCVRGVLEWGVYPPALAPNRDVLLFTRQAREAQARGFNLIKFCLWVPPQRLLDALDELGMLAWIEYPTWHPRFDAATRDALSAEFDEFFRFDRSHPSVIVRSLTCETGPSAPLPLLQALHARAHALIPDAFVEDDSSWIEWNRVHDFYDDHPYGNNDSWPATLRRLHDYVSARTPKPLLLGEAIAADTWLDRAGLRDAPIHYRPLALDALDDWEARLRNRFGATVAQRLGPESLRFAMNERKDQIEAFRLLQRDGGYVVSVARDFRLATMGLADAFDRWKWRPDEWEWHGETMLLLGEGTPRALAGGEAFELPVFVAHHGAEPLRAGALRWRFGDDLEGEIDHAAIAPGSVAPIGTIEGEAPDVIGSYAVDLEAVLVAGGSGRAERTNRWTFHVVPAHEDEDEHGADGHDHGDGERRRGPARLDAVGFTHALTTEWIDQIEQGRAVVLETSDTKGSFVAPSTWLLRGSPWMPERHPVVAALSREFFLDLCVKDLHPRGLVPLAQLFEHVDPIVAFWDTHDHGSVVDHGLLFETRIGEGRLLVTTLPLAGNAAAEHLREVLIDHLENGPPPSRALPPEVVAAMRARLSAKTLDLTALEWEFRPEPAAGESAAASSWTKIRAGAHWEGQGFAALDGKARYRIDIESPPDWADGPLFLGVDGADDAYWVFFDGIACGSGGDVADRITAFDSKACHRLAERLAPGKHVLEIVVLDWQGAGGLHRPLRLATAPLSEDADFLRAE